MGDSLLGLGGSPRPLAIGGTPTRPLALALAVLCTVGYALAGLSLFLSPGRDAFEGLGYLFDSVLLGLAALSLGAAWSAARGSRAAWVMLSLPLVAAGGILGLACIG